MTVTLTRRATLIGAAALLPFAPLRAAASPKADALGAAEARIATLEQQHGGRLGVVAMDTETGASITYRPDERFPLCSTFKFLAAAAILRRVDAGTEKLDRQIAYGSSDLVTYSPVTQDHAGAGMPLGEICAAAIEWSDNTAGNLMLGTIGGPQGLTQYVRSLGDSVTRLDRTEPTLNTAIAGDQRDTTSPQAMIADLKRILLGEELSAASRQQLEAWLIDDRVSAKRIRAGLPPTWRAGDKTGSGDNGTANTVAILWPPSGAPILAAVYYTGSSASADLRNAVHAEIGRIIAQTFPR
jgi:beta-lactamase class A